MASPEPQMQVAQKLGEGCTSFAWRHQVSGAEHSPYSALASQLLSAMSELKIHPDALARTPGLDWLLTGDIFLPCHQFLQSPHNLKSVQVPHSQSFRSALGELPRATCNLQSLPVLPTFTLISFSGHARGTLEKSCILPSRGGGLRLPQSFSSPGSKPKVVFSDFGEWEVYAHGCSFGPSVERILPPGQPPPAWAVRNHCLLLRSVSTLSWAPSPGRAPDCLSRKGFPP